MFRETCIVLGRETFSGGTLGTVGTPTTDRPATGPIGGLGQSSGRSRWPPSSLSCERGCGAAHGGPGARRRPAFAPAASPQEPPRLVVRAQRAAARAQPACSRRRTAHCGTNRAARVHQGRRPPARPRTRPAGPPRAAAQGPAGLECQTVSAGPRQKPRHVAPCSGECSFCNLLGPLKLLRHDESALVP